MAPKKKEVGYADVKWKGHTLKVVSVIEGGVLCVGSKKSSGPLPPVVFFVPEDEIEK